MFQITISPRARKDFLEVIDYIRQDDPRAAQYFGSDLFKHVELLAVFPHLGMSIRRGSNIRKALYTPIRIYYRIDEKRKRLEVIHFWHAARQDPML